MKKRNVKLIKDIKKGWFLTISDFGVENTLVVTSTELWMLGKIIKDNMDEIMKEMEEDKC